jgi:hypothetical protein
MGPVFPRCQLQPKELSLFKKRVSAAIGSLHRLLRRCMHPRGSTSSIIMEEVPGNVIVVPRAGGTP